MPVRFFRDPFTQLNSVCSRKNKTPRKARGIHTGTHILATHILFLITRTMKKCIVIFLFGLSSKAVTAQKYLFNNGHYSIEFSIHRDQQDTLRIRVETKNESKKVIFIPEDELSFYRWSKNKKLLEINNGFDYKDFNESSFKLQKIMPGEGKIWTISVLRYSRDSFTIALKGSLLFENRDSAQGKVYNTDFKKAHSDKFSVFEYYLPVCSTQSTLAASKVF